MNANNDPLAYLTPRRLLMAVVALAVITLANVTVFGDSGLLSMLSGKSDVASKTSPAKATIKNEPRDERSGVSLIRRHIDAIEVEIKTEVVFKDGVGTRERNNFGKVTKLLFEAKNGSSIERVFIARDKTVTRFKNREGKLEREVIREGERVNVVEHLPNGNKLYWSPKGPTGKPTVYFDDGKSIYIQVTADGGPTYGPFDVFTRGGQRVYNMLLQNNSGDKTLHVQYFRADGKLWFEQFWVYPTSEPALRQARDYDETGSLVREVLPSGEVQPDKDAKAPMAAKDYNRGTVTATNPVPELMLEQGRNNQNATDNALPQDPLRRIVSRPLPSIEAMRAYLTYSLPDESVLDKLAEIK